MLFLPCLALLPPCLGYSLVERGQKYSGDVSQEYLVYFQEEEGQLVSPWHDIPLYAEETELSVNMVVEIPRFSQAKFEISRPRRLNPIVQDRAGGEARYLPNVFPWHGHLCNYGALPQTWENPFHSDPWTGLLGDRDPIDVCELGSKPLATGTVLPVKVNKWAANGLKVRIQLLQCCFCCRSWEFWVCWTAERRTGRFWLSMRWRRPRRTWRRWRT